MKKLKKNRSSPSHYGLKIHHPPGPTQLHQLNSSISSLSSHQRLSCQWLQSLEPRTRKSPKKSIPWIQRFTYNKQPFLRWSRRCSSFSNVPQWPLQLCTLAKTTKGKTIVTISDHRIPEGNFLGNFRGKSQTWEINALQKPPDTEKSENDTSIHLKSADWIHVFHGFSTDSASQQSNPDFFHAHANLIHPDPGKRLKRAR